MECLVLGLAPPPGRPIDRARRVELGELLGGRLGTAVEVMAARRYSDLVDWLRQRRVHLAWLPPAMFVRARDEASVAPIVSLTRTSGLFYRGALFVPETSTVGSLDELRGKRVAWVDKHSCSGCLFPRLAMMERGIELEGFFASETAFGSHGAVIRALAEGRAEVGGTYVNLESEPETDEIGMDTVVSAGWLDADPPMSVRVLLVSRAIPNDVVCAGPALDIDEERRIAEVLHEVGSDPDARTVIEGVFGSRGFGPVGPRDHDIVRVAMRRGLMPVPKKQHRAKARSRRG